MAKVINLKSTGVGTTWNPKILEKHVAPEISRFTSATVPDINERFPEAPHWAGNYLLGSVLRRTYRDRVRQVVMAYLRRASHGFAAYHEARRRTLDYLHDNDPRRPYIYAYLHAIAEWEVFAIDITMAYDLIKWMAEGHGAFTKKDGSKAWRLYDIGNKIKHVPKAIEAGECTADETLPLWLNNSGLNSFGLTVTYSEAADVLVDVCELADEIQAPQSAFERYRAAKKP